MVRCWKHLELKADFITSLKGDTGATGSNGADGADGVDGKSAYQTWLDAGNTWNQSRLYHFFKRRHRSNRS
ncbi:hypothetical protein [Tenacibaculum ascidiaceicola]|uniref:hypothetical protein n=1 Tax=Tenacibaculum ascidiaceicola TaxID=1699411 RepID=UPI003CE51D9E